MDSSARAAAGDPELPLPKPELPVPKAELPVPKAELPVPKAELPVPKAELPLPKAELPLPKEPLPKPWPGLPLAEATAFEPQPPPSKAEPPPSNAEPPPSKAEPPPSKAELRPATSPQKPELLLQPGTEITRLSEASPVPVKTIQVLESTTVFRQRRRASEIGGGGFVAVERRPAAFPGPVHPRRRIGEADRWSDLGIQRARRNGGATPRRDPFSTPFDAEPLEESRLSTPNRGRWLRRALLLVLVAGVAGGYCWKVLIEPEGSVHAESDSTPEPPATSSSSTAATAPPPVPGPIALGSNDALPVDLLVDMCQQAVGYAHARATAALAAAGELGPRSPGQPAHSR